MTESVKKRKSLPKKKKVYTGPSILDFLNDLTYEKKYILNETNEQSYSPFMITRFLAVKTKYLKLADFLNKHSSHLSKYEFHSTAMMMIPTKEKFFMQGCKVKYTPKMAEVQDDLKLIQDYFSVSKEKSYEYYLCLTSEEQKKLCYELKVIFGIIEL